MNVRRSCRLALLRPSVWYQKSEARDQSALRLRIREIAMDRPRFGCLTPSEFVKERSDQEAESRPTPLLKSPEFGGDVSSA